MSEDYLIELLSKVRTVLYRYMFDADEAIRDDVAEICMTIDDVLPDPGRAQVTPAAAEHSPLARSAA
jgi:hypothetical protein